MADKGAWDMSASLFLLTAHGATEFGTFFMLIYCNLFKIYLPCNKTFISIFLTEIQLLLKLVISKLKLGQMAIGQNNAITVY